MIYLVSRHAGASEWAQRQGLNATVVAHADEQFWNGLEQGDVCIGTLPMHLAARANTVTGQPFGFFSMVVPAELRGQELTADDMETCNASIQWFEVSASTAPAGVLES